MRKIYVLITKSHTILSKLISKVTHTYFTHSTLSLDNKMDDLVSFTRKYVHFPFPGGYVHESVYSGIMMKQKEIPCILFSCEIDDEKYEWAKKLIKYMDEHKKEYKYNYMGAVECWLGKKPKNSKKFFCSQFVSIVLNKCGISLQKEPYKMRPHDLLYSGLKCEFYGIIEGLRYSLAHNKIK